MQTRQHPKFVVKEMESMYMEELRSSINLLKSNLESLPVSKGGTDSKYSLQKLKRYNRYLLRQAFGPTLLLCLLWLVCALISVVMLCEYERARGGFDVVMIIVRLSVSVNWASLCFDVVMLCVRVYVCVVDVVMM